MIDMFLKKPHWWLILLLLIVGCGAEELPEPAVPLTEQQTLGQTVFIKECNACHSLVDPEGGLGPSMTQIATTAETRVAEQDASEYLRRSITHPSEYITPGYDNVMPIRDLSEEELEAVVSYLLTLR